MAGTPVPEKSNGKGVCLMAMRKLRVYTGPDADPAGVSLLESSLAVDSVKVTLGEILPILADAVASQRTWLSDFEADEITISSDLFDVLQAYRHFRRPGA
jgi:hypothetical protein